MLRVFKKLDWWLVGSLVVLMSLSLFTMSSFSDGSILIQRQLLISFVSLVVFLIIASLDLSFLKQSRVIALLYSFGVILLLLLFFVGSTFKGATSWFDFGIISFQPSDLMKLFLILILAKYLARRHIEIRAPRHVLVTALYFIIPFLLIFLQPDFGTAIILFIIWFGMILVAGISKKHLFILFGVGVVAFACLWLFVFKPYQKDRILDFLDPLADIQGTGYNAYQSVVAVGSGQILGKGIGFGTQSRLSFLPEYKTDFIFAAVSEEWGFAGSLLILGLFSFVMIRILMIGYRTKSNFELLLAVGLVLYIMGHVVINIGMNLGVMPVTGVTLPFMSHGGSHLIVEWASLGVLFALAREARTVYRDQSSEVYLR